MKILHLCLGNYYADGFGYQENLITKCHKKEGFDVVIIASRINYDSKDSSQYLTKPGEYINEDGIRVKRIEYKYKRNNLLLKFSRIFRTYEKIYESIEKENPDIIFVHNPQFWDIKQVVRYKERNKEVIIYADNHADYINSAKNFLSRNILHKIIWRYRIKSFLPYCERIWGVTPNRCDFLREVYKVPTGKIGLLPMGADSKKINFDNKDKIRKKIRKMHLLEENDFVIISGGKIDERKKIHNLIEAVNQLNHPRIKLLLFGTPNQEMKDTIESITNTKHIREVGWLKSDLVYDYFLASDLAVFPGTHSVLWEQAVGTGIPCIFRKWEGMTHVDVGGNCIFIEGGDIKTIKNAISNIYNDETKYKEMERTAIEKGMSFFSYDEIAKRAIGKTKY
ncbi:MAG: glycosyltransferase family 4 protein [Spirochaetales bacterium]|nr:glycosyltransferase family 4 protein [Spirochaetales bacterium]